MNVSSPAAGLLHRNRYELQLIVEDLKAREKRESDPTRKAELQSQLDVWEQMYQAAGGDPSRVRPASFGNDLRMALSKTGFPMLDPERYSNRERNIAQMVEFKTAASGMPGPDHEVLTRREGVLRANLAEKKSNDRLSAIGIGMAQMSWIAAAPAYMLAGSGGLLGCAGLLVGGVGLHLVAQQRDRNLLVGLVPSAQDLPVLGRWMENGPRLVEDYVRRQAELYNNSWMEKALKPEPSGITQTQGAIMVGGVRLKTRAGS